MKRFVRSVALIMMLAFMLATTAFASSDDTNTSQKALNQNVDNLISIRQSVLLEDPVDLIRLNEIDIQLSDLGVDFLTSTEVRDMFPDAMACMGEVSNVDNARMSVEAPDSELNSWMLLRTSSYEKNGEMFDIMRLIGQPISTNSPLWTEGGNTIPVTYDHYWRAGSETFFNIVVESTFAYIAPITVSVLSALADILTSIQPSTLIHPSQAVYYWQCATTVSFSYVILTDQPDEMMELTHISSRCESEIGYILSGVNVIQDGSVISPNLNVGEYSFLSWPYTYGNMDRAIDGYYHGIQNDCLGQITVTGPENKTSAIIYPKYVISVGQCEGY